MSSTHTKDIRVTYLHYMNPQSQACTPDQFQFQNPNIPRKTALALYADLRGLSHSAKTAMVLSVRLVVPDW